MLRPDPAFGPHTPPVPIPPPIPAQGLGVRSFACAQRTLDADDWVQLAG